ncbi:hypothetical protein IID62_07565, partial [candidate division KSB1 bacterium]|nr:hypothetical protein [candidate division KSB1 bacterium]
MDLKKPVLLITLLCYLFTNEGYSQTIDFNDPLADSGSAVAIMFFGRQPSARVEAMGKILWNLMAAVILPFIILPR